MCELRSVDYPARAFGANPDLAHLARADARRPSAGWGRLEHLHHLATTTGHQAVMRSARWLRLATGYRGDMAGMRADSGRFAPSTTGAAHPGTLLAALLSWLDARSRCGAILLRLEDLDRTRCTPAHAQSMREDLAWFGLDWDEVVEQHACAPAHDAALDALAAGGFLYPSAATRAQVKAMGRRAPDGGWAYDNSERDRALPAAGWRSCREALRVRLPGGIARPRDEGGLDLGQDPSLTFGDPVVRARDGSVTYQFAVVVDDAAAGIARVVRGRDIAPSTATQCALQSLLELRAPVYRHHLLLLEPRGGKLAKLHGSVGMPQLRPHYDARRLCAFLARCAGLVDDTVTACAPSDLIAEFSWSRVRTEDLVVDWTGERLVAGARP